MFIRFDLKVCPELTDEVTGGVLELLSQLKTKSYFLIDEIY